MRCISGLIVLLATVSAVNSSRAEQADLLGERMPYAAFDAMPKTQIEVGGGKLDVAFAEGTFALPRKVGDGSVHLLQPLSRC